ncbi:hypothetical protein EUX98_g8626 [Antrodiella citrinella]|uniref:Uncharacterized protein n=1 Tax=Antrodiella citrinella TaxID=2447956 RepID=A0A4S4M5C8_9APHY|nr:hypothetical protein EUX98_g8626 [Antrodiella citrinella]
MNVSLEMAKSLYAGRAMDQVDDWHKLCRYLYRLHSTWSGQGPVASNVYSSAGNGVHRIKVDEKEGIVITSHSLGGIKVSDLETDTLLWELSSGYVRAWAHVEYGNGFLIFDRFGEYKEVWRLATHMGTEACTNACAPDVLQSGHSDFAEQRNPSSDLRGHFKPWALLRSPEWGRAFRFVYPTLLVGSFSKAYLFDVESGSLVQTVENTQQVDGVPLGEIHYVEVSDQHVFICGSVELRAFNRTDGRLAFRMSPDEIPDMTQLRAGGLRRVSYPRTRCAEVQPIPLTLDEEISRTLRYFIAVHVCGEDLAILRDDAEVIFIRNYKTAFQKKQPMTNFAVKIRIRDSAYSVDSVRAVYMAFEHGRLATAGVFVFTLDETIHSTSNSSSRNDEHPTLWSQPLAIVCCRVRSLENRTVLNQVSCLQMTESKLFLAHHPLYAPLNTQDEGPKPASASPKTDELAEEALPTEPDPIDEELEHVANDDVDDMLFADDDDDDWLDEDFDINAEDDDQWEPEVRSVVCIDFSP